MKKLILIIFFIGINSAGFAQLRSYSFEQIDSLQQIRKRKVVVFIHTDWCKYCQAMKNSTFKNKTIIAQLNSEFYFIDLNAEEKRTIRFNNRTFNYEPTRNNSGVNELAIQLGTVNNQLTYPIICVLNLENEIILQDTNYRNAKDLELILSKLKEPDKS
ncbi:thioredoxin family protein [Flavobacterium sp. LS1R47]|uniref:Thioredoxin family protein n=1 Tax=Flavobacterium frigoritolerans TaxID=2987686 RepID=A0A9X2ZKI7_9FLAO|nr:thioredoxin family protein [Flavobacterium frigoritolerans]MCV9932405.1 thioredoxin family protein [Flavobacterium frigoritolerans]